MKEFALTIHLEITHPYLHLPVRYDAPLGMMRFRTDGQQERKFGIKFANAAPDYTVFADVEHLIGQTIEVTFEGEDGVDLAQLHLADRLPDAATMYKERYRPQFHFSSRRGFINDPNGLVYYAGEYHLYYQHLPFGTDVGFDLKFWGHAVSTDLIHWQELPPVLYPDEHGAMYSGSAVVDWRNSSGFQVGDAPPLVALYTADGSSADVERPFTQCLAYSNDRGQSWTKDENNPVLGHIVGENRDPRVIWHEATQRWIMVLYLDGARWGFFGSPNLREWTKLSEIELADSHSCPDLFPLAVDGDPAQIKWVLWGANTRYMIGDFDGTRFIPEGELYRQQPAGTAYAAQTWNDIPAADGRTIQIAWFRTATPGMPFTHCMTLPYELSLKRAGSTVHLCAEPVRELKKLRTNHRQWRDIVLDVEQLSEFNPRQPLTPARRGDWGRYPLGTVGDTLDIECVIDLGSAAAVALSIRGVSVVVDAQNRCIAIEGGQARLQTPTSAPFPSEGGNIHLRILVDRTTFEVFADAGRVVLPLGVIPVDDNHTLAMAAKGGRAAIISLDSWDLRSIWRTR